MVKSKRGTNSKQKINVSQMGDAVKRSGYLMEQRVLPLIEGAGFYVEANPVYLDPITGKSREYDFSAITAMKLFKEDYDFVFLKLIGECINNSQPIVFFPHSTGFDFLHVSDIKCVGIPTYFVVERESEDEISLVDFFRIDDWHHYARGTRSSQYCTFVRKKGNNDWQAWHDEEHHAIFSGLVEATRHEMQTLLTTWQPPPDGEEPVNVSLFYPLVIVQKDLFECTEKRGRPSFTKKNHSQFRKSVISGRKMETFIIDVIVESYLQDYLDIVTSELETLKKRFRRKKKLVRTSIDRIISRVKDAETKGELKDYKEFLEF